MKISFYIKLFMAFIAFAILLLAFSSFAFNNFYKFHNDKKDRENILNILNHQEEVFRTYLKVYDEKVTSIQNSVLDFTDKEKIISYLKNTQFLDRNIVEFRIIALDGQETLKIKKEKSQLNVEDDVNLKNIFSEPFFQEIRVLDVKKILEDNSNSHEPTLVNFILRNENDFYILTVDFKNIFENLSESFSKKTLIFNANQYFDAKDEYFSKKIYLRKNQYFEFFIRNNLEKDNEFIADYYQSVIIIGFCLALILSLLFSEPIAKLNKKVEDENQKLDLSIQKNFLELNENQKIIDNYVMFMRIDERNKITDISHAFYYFLGYSKEELIGHHYSILLDKNVNKRKQIDILKQLKDGMSYYGEIKGNKKDNEVFWVDLFIEAIYKDKKIVGYTLICTDITNKKKIEELYEDINNQVEQYNAIFENVDSGIALIDLEGNFVKLNTTFGEFLHYENEELLSMNCLDIINKESKNLLKNILEEARDIGNISNIEKIFIRKDEKPIHLELSLSLLSDNKHFVFVVNSLEDKRKLQELNQHLEEKINQEVEKSIQKDKIHQQEQIKNAKLTSIGSLAAGIAHEINTPLTYIKGNLELMSYDIMDLPYSEIKERMTYDSQKMKEGIDRIANIVESMREMSQSSKESKEKTNIYSTLITSLTMAYNRSKQVSRIFLNENLFDIVSSNKNEFVYFSKVQKQRIEQVWIIVINNALDELIKMEDYEKRALYISLFEEKNEIIIRFKDTAGGINENIIDDIFEPFISSKEHSGMGVGLNIAKKIVDEQDGTIEAYNEDNGAVFEIRLKKCEEE